MRRHLGKRIGTRPDAAELGEPEPGHGQRDRRADNKLSPRHTTPSIQPKLLPQAAVQLRTKHDHLTCLTQVTRVATECPPSGELARTSMLAFSAWTRS
jgi:hypothetical protein